MGPNGFVGVPDRRSQKRGNLVRVTCRIEPGMFRDIVVDDFHGYSTGDVSPRMAAHAVGYDP